MNGLSRRDVRGTLKICGGQKGFDKSIIYTAPRSTAVRTSEPFILVHRPYLSRLLCHPPPLLHPALRYLPHNTVGLLCCSLCTLLSLLRRSLSSLCRLCSLRYAARHSLRSTHMTQHLLHQPSPLLLLPLPIKHADPPAPLEAVPRHLELVHRVQVLHVALRRGPVGRAREPEVEVLVSSRLEVERVVARVQVGELVEELEG
jgi:hypothetical protein